MAKLAEDTRGDVTINNIPLKHLSFADIDSSLKNISKDINTLELENSELRDLKYKMDTLKANIENKKLTDAQFRDFVKTLF